MIGLLIVSHGAFGESLIHSASHVLGRRPLYLRQLGVTVHDEPEAILPVAEDLVRYVDRGKGVLIRALNYREESDLESLVDKAISGATEGVMRIRAS